MQIMRSYFNYRIPKYANLQYILLYYFVRFVSKNYQTKHL